MTARTRRLAAAIAIAATCAVAVFAVQSARARAMAPPIVELTPESLPSLRDSFNAGESGTRVLALLSPT